MNLKRIAHERDSRENTMGTHEDNSFRTTTIARIFEEITQGQSEVQGGLEDYWPAAWLSLFCHVEGVHTKHDHYETERLIPN